MISEFSDYWSTTNDYFLTQVSGSSMVLGPWQLAYINLLVCKQGHAEFSVNFKNIRLEVGQALMVADDALVVLKQPSTDFLAFGCFLKRSFASEVAYELPSLLFNYLHHLPLINVPEQQQPLLSSWIEQTEWISSLTQHQRPLLRNQLQNFFLAVVNGMDEQSFTSQDKHSRQEQYCWRFWELIGVHAKQERSVQFYAKQLAITPYYLAKICDEILNDAPKTLIDRQVILEIKRELMNTGHSIERVAEQMNFNDPSYLARYFKKHTGVGLREFRRKAQR